MSALPPKEDMDQEGCDVRFVPIREERHCSKIRRHCATLIAASLAITLERRVIDRVSVRQCCKTGRQMADLMAAKGSSGGVLCSGESLSGASFWVWASRLESQQPWLRRVCLTLPIRLRGTSSRQSSGPTVPFGFSLERKGDDLYPTGRIRRYGTLYGDRN
jgi:hypothetical protein